MIVNPRNIVYIGNMRSQSQQIYERMEAAGALPSQLRWFADRISQSVAITGNTQEWIRLDRVIERNDDIFYTVGRSPDQKFGCDEQGAIYCSKDYAIQILQDQVREIGNTRDVAQNWALMLAAGLVVVFLIRIVG